MKATELMVCDWVLCPDNMQRQVRYLQVRPSVIGIGGSSYDEDEIQPIPLTPEILEKNGFDMSDKEVMQYHFEEDGEKYHFSLRQMYDKDGKPHGYSFYAFNVLTLLDYVHQLQHALKLCEINKEIEI